MTQEQIEQARKPDLLTYLQQCNPSELVALGASNYCTKTHDSLKISNGKWYWWSKGIGGKSALDYLIKVENIPFLQAVEMILEHTPVFSFPTNHAEERKTKKAFHLPPKHANNRRVFSYLKSRGIDDEIIHFCISTHQLYEDAIHHNCVFVGYCGDIPKYAALRGTLPNSTFVGEVAGSDKRYGFAIPKNHANSLQLHVFESAIDSLSYLTLQNMEHRNWHQYSCLSLAGIYCSKHPSSHPLPLALDTYLQQNPTIQTIVLCLDADEPGLTAAQELRRCLARYEVYIQPPQQGKDYNDLLQQKKGLMGKVKTRGGEAR